MIKIALLEKSTVRRRSSLTGFTFILLFFISLVSGSKAVDKVAATETLAATAEFELKALSGNSVSLSSYKDKKAVVLIFWTTWCPYCRTALNSLKEDVVSLKDMGIELLAINVGESKLKVSNFVERHSLNFKVLLDQDSLVADSYDLLGVPTYFVINKAGEVVFSGSRLPKEKLKELTAK